MTEKKPGDWHRGYRLWVDKESTVLVRLWENGIVEVATREQRGQTWGPPVRLKEEK